jgi:hypothetical protein
MMLPGGCQLDPISLTGVDPRGGTVDRFLSLRVWLVSQRRRPRRATGSCGFPQERPAYREPPVGCQEAICTQFCMTTSL